mgnify:FL=1
MKHMKKGIALLLSVGMAVGVFSGCGNDQSNTSSGGTGSAAASAASTAGTAVTDYSKVKIGLMLTGSAKDGGWSQLAAEAVDTIKEKYPGCTVNYSESIASTDYESTMRGYADAGYTIIVSHGAEFLDTAKQMAQEYPDIRFICTSAQSGQDPNLTGIDFATYQLGFLDGAACAMATKTKKIGVVGSNKIDSIVTWAQGVADGAKYIDASCETIPVYTGSYDDALKAKQAVDALKQQGVDIVTQNADACGVGAVQECDALGLMNVGAVSDQTTEGQSCFVSVLQDAKLGIELAVDRAIQGQLPSGFVNMGAPDGVITLSDYSGKYADVLTDEQKATLKDLWQKSHDGVDLKTLVQSQAQSQS